MKKIFLGASLLLLNFGQANAQTFNNSGVETWVNYTVGFLPPTTLTRPANWFSGDSLVHFYAPLLFANNVQKQLFKSTDAHTGSFSAQIVTHLQDTTTLPGLLANAQPQVDILSYDPNNPISAFSYNGGTSVTQRIASVSAWIKFVPIGLDAGTITAQAVLAGAGAGGKDSVVGQGTLPILGAITSFTQKNVPIVYNNPSVIPNKILVVFSSSNFLTAQDGSAMWVDDVTMTAASGTKEMILDGEAVDVYPNPSFGVLNIHTSIKHPLQWVMTDASGKQVLAKTFSSQTSINTSPLAKGLYFYQLLNEEGWIVREGQVEVK